MTKPLPSVRSASASLLLSFFIVQHSEKEKSNKDSQWKWWTSKFRMHRFHLRKEKPVTSPLGKLGLIGWKQQQIRIQLSAGCWIQHPGGHLMQVWRSQVQDTKHSICGEESIMSIMPAFARTSSQFWLLMLSEI